MNGITNFDGFAFNPATFASDPADVLGAKSTSQQYVYSGSYTQPFTKWWSQKLTLARATESLELISGKFSARSGDGVVEASHFRLPQKSIRPAIALNGSTIFRSPSLWRSPPVINFANSSERIWIRSRGATTIPTKIVSSNAGFAEAKLNLWDRVFGTAGIRQDEYNVFGSATTYRVTGGYLHKETGTKLRGSYGTGFRAPTINQLFFPGFGNPNLKPEKSKGLDVALDQSLLNDRVLLSVGYFWTRYQNLILSVFDPVGVCRHPRHAGVLRAEVGQPQGRRESKPVQRFSLFVTSRGSRVWICSSSTRIRVQKT